jgi:preprotein translocase subunit SecD
LAGPLSFTGTRGTIWADYTTAHVGNQVAFMLDGTMLSAPEIREPIVDGETRITGGYTRRQAQQLADWLASR